MKRWIRRLAMRCSSSGERPHTSLLVWPQLKGTANVEANSITAMIFLEDNTFLEREIVPSDIKPRLLGEFNRHLPPQMILLTYISLKVTGAHVPVLFWSIPT